MMTSKPPTALVAVTDAIRWRTGCSRPVALSLAAVERLRAENAAAREEWQRASEGLADYWKEE